MCEGVANAKAGVVDLGMSESVAEGVSESTSVLCLPESKSISKTSCCFFTLERHIVKNKAILRSDKSKLF